MIRINSLKAEIGHNSETELKQLILKRLMISERELIEWHPVKMSVDARHKDEIRYVYCIDATVKNEKPILNNKRLKDVSHVEPVVYKDPIRDKHYSSDKHSRPIIVGAGPAGLFCALKLAQAGLEPILIERGAPVEERTRDVSSFWASGRLDPESNVQFGEGGAGTFSDGKLNTMVHDEFGRMKEVFRIFTEHGASPSIMYVNKPHIGTDQLIAIVRSMRERIRQLGGEVRFHSRMTDIIIRGDRVCGIRLADGSELETDTLVLAIGHSARDTFTMLYGKGIAMERKPFAAGVRIQHPQEMINRDRYGNMADRLPAADYKLTYNTIAEKRGVYSFCMCPGGFVVNASSEPEMLVVNGMSNSDRAEATANSAIVVAVNTSDIEGESVLAGMEFQRRLEGGAYRCRQGAIPAQYLGDFLKGRETTAITDNIPNTKGAWAEADLNTYLPSLITEPIREAMSSFERTIHGFSDDHAVVLGVESRTSSPVRIIRGADCQSINIQGLYPCGEGAGYAGGITSAAMDGLRIYESIITKKEEEYVRV